LPPDLRYLRLCKAGELVLQNLFNPSYGLYVRRPDFIVDPSNPKYVLFLSFHARLLGLTGRKSGTSLTALARCQGQIVR